MNECDCVFKQLVLLHLRLAVRKMTVIHVTNISKPTNKGNIYDYQPLFITVVQTSHIHPLNFTQ